MSQGSSLTAAIILAAGESTRMKSATPKVLHTLGGKTLLHRVMTSVEGLNPVTTAVVVRFEGERVAQAASSYTPDAIIVKQDDIPGTGRAVQCALASISSRLEAQQGPVLIIASDMPLLDTETLQALTNAHKEQGNAATVLTTTLANPFGYGRIIRDESGHVQRIVEQKDANTAERDVKEVNTSVYVFEPSVLLKATQNLDADNAQKEFYLTDALETARQFGAVGAYEAPDSELAEGINDRVQLAHLASLHNKRVCERWMRDGVTILDPSTTWIDDDVVLARDVEVLPGSFLQGKTRVEEGAVVGPYTTLIDAHIEAGAHVERSRVQETHIGEKANIGPWTYLRPGNELAANTKAGAFVEMKKAHIDEGSKVPHLSYVGDAHIAEHTNVGGGTITANYDGTNKHHTEIGANVHVGAGNLFVAPVTVGSGVTTGAGSVVRHDVEDNAMVYSENSQHAVENWTPHATADASNNNEERK
ncbi:MAG: bifunctional UDP-N-acetylglucosamine diphosphorylase/glucosamine-1-phosphate N-acetyltransferase GlmU [Bifidobacteriaceae bacterium]|nr:bifunctional UDP-N-acetylglucosamine diphosphorylase/glucosamine-1-phosphate N-acetyltransferase GlmU [Bifidobacteriaceae bacterium]MCI1915000.1 bifunctional UDP-N-acetylglucosamine diphosphorylase/glucosamine-1-phosphate N-acetyltransferase GlmU [Bifidobacteriaceae bacterium]